MIDAAAASRVKHAIFRVVVICVYRVYLAYTSVIVKLFVVGSDSAAVRPGTGDWTGLPLDFRRDEKCTGE